MRSIDKGIADGWNEKVIPFHTTYIEVCYIFCNKSVLIRSILLGYFRYGRENHVPFNPVNSFIYEYCKYSSENVAEVYILSYRWSESVTVCLYALPKYSNQSVDSNSNGDAKFNTIVRMGLNNFIIWWRWYARKDNGANNIGIVVMQWRLSMRTFFLIRIAISA